MQPSDYLAQLLPKGLLTMRNPHSFPNDLITSLSEGSGKSLEGNCLRFLAGLRKPRDRWSDWKEGLFSFNVKTMTNFELSTRCTWLLEEIPALLKEGSSSDAPLSSEEVESHITAALNAEYMILQLTFETPLRDHPFLLHWVTAADHIRGELLANRDNLGTEEYSPQEILLRSRLEIIYFALDGLEQYKGKKEWPAEALGAMSPLELMEHAVRRKGDPEWLDLTTYAMALEKAGIPMSWELEALLPDPAAQSPEVRSVDVDRAQDHRDQHYRNEYGAARETAPASRPTAKASDATKAPTLQQIEHYLRVDPENTRQYLIRQDISLDSLNTLCHLAARDNHALESAGFEKIHVMREYIDYALRTIEAMGQEEHYNESSNTSNVSNDPSSDTSNEPRRGRDEQERAITLLAMFLKHLVSNDLVRANEIYFEINEFCTRYIFVKEVRAFKDFLEGRDTPAPYQRQGGSRVGG
ncbi:hypothetical protein FKW77_006143 [Venturia effusa]|uniref:Uncharacterized protein n=1 Tax=Venturia effusa TaxID=50376 RepID=A0A517LKC4_9PEZI|nr:hypothetical protein FKW77_006143 [Venturia effusa]